MADVIAIFVSGRWYIHFFFFFFFFFFVVDVITTRELYHGQMLLPIVADVIATGQP